MPLALLAAAWLTVGGAPAAGVELRWDAPAGCPAQAALERQIAAMRVTRPAPASTPRVSFRVEQRGERWHLVGEISGAANSGRRELSAATCAELADAAVLITVIAIDPDAPAPGPDEPPIPPDDSPVLPPPTSPDASPLVPPPTAPSAPPVVPPPTAPSTPPAATDPAAPPTAPAIDPAGPPASPPGPARPAPRPRPSALLGVSAGLGLGATAAPAGLLRLALGLRGARWSAALVQDFWLPRQVDLAAAPEYGGRFWLWSAGVRGCAVLRARRVEAPMCATVAAGVMSGAGVGSLSASRQRRAPWAAVALGPGLRVPLGRRVGLAFAAELLVMLARPRFEIATKGVVCCTSPVGGQFTGGVEVRLP